MLTDARREKLIANLNRQAERNGILERLGPGASTEDMDLVLREIARAIVMYIPRPFDPNRPRYILVPDGRRGFVVLRSNVIDFAEARRRRRLRQACADQGDAP